MGMLAGDGPLKMSPRKAGGGAGAGPLGCLPEKQVDAQAQSTVPSFQ